MQGFPEGSKEFKLLAPAGFDLPCSGQYRTRTAVGTHLLTATEVREEGPFIATPLLHRRSELHSQGVACCQAEASGI